MRPAKLILTVFLVIGSLASAEKAEGKHGIALLENRGGRPVASEPQLKKIYGNEAKELWNKLEAKEIVEPVMVSNGSYIYHKVEVTGEKLTHCILTGSGLREHFTDEKPNYSCTVVTLASTKSAVSEKQEVSPKAGETVAGRQFDTVTVVADCKTSDKLYSLNILTKSSTPNEFTAVVLKQGHVVGKYQGLQKQNVAGPVPLGLISSHIIGKDTNGKVIFDYTEASSNFLAGLKATLINDEQINYPASAPFETGFYDRDAPLLICSPTSSVSR